MFEHLKSSGREFDELAALKAECSRLIDVCKDLNSQNNTTFYQSCINRKERDAALAEVARLKAELVKYKREAKDQHDADKCL